MMTAEERYAYWQRPDVRKAQFEAAISELAHWQDFDVYRVFVEVGKKLVERGNSSLVDIGAGAGQYAPLWLGACGGSEYCTCYNGGAIFPVELRSASFEYAENPLQELSDHVQFTDILVMHRLRFHDAPGEFVNEPSYCSTMVPLWRWNRDELTNSIGARKITRHVWPNDPNQETWVIE